MKHRTLKSFAAQSLFVKHLKWMFDSVFFCVFINVFSHESWHCLCMFAAEWERKDSFHFLSTFLQPMIVPSLKAHLSVHTKQTISSFALGSIPQDVERSTLYQPNGYGIISAFVWHCFVCAIMLNNYVLDLYNLKRSEKKWRKGHTT